MKYFSPGLLDGSVTTAKLADGSVTTPKRANLAVATAKIDNLAGPTEKLDSVSVGHNKISSQTVSLAGTITTKSSVDLALTRDCYWPMIHVSDLEFVHMVGHSVDISSPNSPRFGLYNDNVSSETFDVDYRHITP